MPAGNWLLWMALSAVAAAAVFVHYRRRETPGRGRLLLAALRAAALAVLLLLLFSPELPGAGGGRASGTQVLLDASLSMEIPEPGGRSRWQQAVDVARSRAGNRPVLLFGETPRPVTAAALPADPPGDARSRLLPALQAAAEAGVRRVVVVTDGGIEDADAAARWAPRLGIEIATVRVGAAVSNRSLAEVSVPAWVETGQAVPVEFGATGSLADSVAVIVRSGGRVLGRAAVAAPGPGRLATGTLDVRVEGPPEGGWVALDVELEGDDVVPDDDRRTAYVFVSAQPAGIALVSLRPDWEPRFLAPVLEQSLGLPLRAYLRGATGQYIRLAGGLQAGTPATEAAVLQAVQQAELVVLHGVGADLPEWAGRSMATARRLLLFPAEDADGLSLPLPVGPSIPGDFFPSATVPSSPVAPLLAGQEMAGISPLAALRTAELPEGAWAPLLATRGRQGAPQPVIVAGESAGRRWAVSLGSGYWRWAFRGDNERMLYTRLWSALAGWLVHERAVAGPGAVRPARMATPRGMPIAWVAPGLLADSLAIQLSDSAGAVVADTTIVPTAGDTAFMAAPQSGHYSYHARAFSDAAVAEAGGPLTVEHYSPEFARPVADLGALAVPATAVRGEGTARRGGTPLHATAVPYVLIVLLLAAEWILRRRWGLR